MSEKPILFNGEMVRAILNGRKTQTRRVIKPQPIIKHGAVTGPSKWTPKHIYNWPVPDWCMMAARYHCPYGQPGDHLWVRETWRIEQRGDKYLLDFRADPGCPTMRYVSADKAARYVTGNLKWHPSIYMPRLLSRITLEVKDVRVERVQEIREEDAIAEGLSQYSGGWGSGDVAYTRPVDAFAALWDSINAKRGYSWSSNPWVWVVDFEQVVTDG